MRLKCSHNAQLTVHQVTGDWLEGTGTYSGTTEPDAAPGEISWLFQPPFDPEVAATISPSGEPGGYIDVDITDLVQAWLSGEPNHGLVIAPLEASGPEASFGFFSREREDADKHPALIFAPPALEDEPIEGLTISVADDPTPAVTLAWDCAPDDLFQVLYSDDLSVWHNDLPGNFVTGPAGKTRASFTADIDPQGPRFYQVTRVADGSQYDTDGKPISANAHYADYAPERAFDGDLDTWWRLAEVASWPPFGSRSTSSRRCRSDTSSSAPATATAPTTATRTFTSSTPATTTSTTP